jgi:tetratricopeptide (TPR) repeat protein
MNRIGLAGSQIAANQVDDARTALLATVEYLDRQTPSEESVGVTTLALSMIAQLENRAGRWREAEAHARRSIELADSKLGGQARALADYSDLGTALLNQGDRSGAEAAYARALALQAGEPLKQADTHMMIAIFYHAHHDEKRAIEHGEAAVALVEKTSGLDNPTGLTLELALCKFLLADGQPTRARPILEAILPKLDAAAMGPVAIGDAQFALARALPKRDRTRAKQLAATALETLGTGGDLGKVHAASVTKWLADPDAK